MHPDICFRHIEMLCPESHPFAISYGTSCCSHHWMVNDRMSGLQCSGNVAAGDLDLCCEPGEVLACPHTDGICVSRPFVIGKMPETPDLVVFCAGSLIFH